MSTQAPSKEHFIQVIHAAVEKEVKAHVEALYEESKKELMARIEVEKAKAIAGITLHIMQKVSIEMFGTEIVMRLEKPKSE